MCSPHKLNLEDNLHFSTSFLTAVIIQLVPRIQGFIQNISTSAEEYLKTVVSLACLICLSLISALIFFGLFHPLNNFLNAHTSIQCSVPQIRSRA